jgi:hypothetical protein
MPCRPVAPSTICRHTMTLRAILTYRNPRLSARLAGRCLALVLAGLSGCQSKAAAPFEATLRSPRSLASGTVEAAAVEIRNLGGVQLILVSAQPIFADLYRGRTLVGGEPHPQGTHFETLRIAPRGRVSVPIQIAGKTLSGDPLPPGRYSISALIRPYRLGERTGPDIARRYQRRTPHHSIDVVAPE